MEARQKLLLTKIIQAHGQQKRRFTMQPYWIHPLTVAHMTSMFSLGGLSFEVALCHDVFEDTYCLHAWLKRILLECGYSIEDTYTILEGTNALTDIYTKENFPMLNRSQRKQAEANRLSMVRSEWQSIKVLDKIDNATSLFQYDAESFGKLFFEEGCLLLRRLDGSDIDAKKYFYNLLKGYDKKFNLNKLTFDFEVSYCNGSLNMVVEDHMETTLAKVKRRLSEKSTTGNATIFNKTMRNVSYYKPRVK